MPNIYNHIERNKRASFIIVVTFVVIVAFLAYFLGQYYDPGLSYGYAGIALIIAGITGMFSYYNSDKIVLAISQAKEVKYDQAPDLHNLVDNMCISSGLPKPRIYVINDTAMNAFATGRNPKNAVICFTTGIISNLEKRELEGVVAHELSHIQNYDMLLMSVVSIFVGSITLLSDFFTRGFLYGSKKRRSSSGHGKIDLLIFLIGLALIILSPIIATLIKMAMSRKREYLADSSAAYMTRYPQGLANALRKL